MQKLYLTHIIAVNSIVKEIILKNYSQFMNIHVEQKNTLRS